VTVDLWLVVALIIPCAATVGALLGLALGTWANRRKRLDDAALQGPRAYADQLREERQRRTDRG